MILRNCVVSDINEGPALFPENWASQVKFTHLITGIGGQQTRVPGGGFFFIEIKE